MSMENDSPDASQLFTAAPHTTGCEAVGSRMRPLSATAWIFSVPVPIVLLTSLCHDSEFVEA